MKPYDPREYWSNVAAEIARRPSGNVVAGDNTPFYRYQRRRFIGKFLRSLPVKGKTVLEVGCGPGGNLLELVKARPLKLAGCDVSRPMIELAIKNTRHLWPVEYVEVDGRTLPFADGQFDITFTATVLVQVHDELLPALLTEICRVTAERVYLFEFTSRHRREGYHWVIRPIDEYAALCAASGFALTETAPLGVYISQTICNTIMSKLNPSSRKEGQPVTKLNALLERSVLPMTALLDKAIRPREGETRMVFQRRPAEEMS